MPENRYLVRAISQVENLVVANTDSLDDAKATAEKLTAATTHGTFRYEVWEGANKLWPPAVVVL